MARKRRVAVLFGGWSDEREVSLRSGAACMEALEHSPYEVVGVDVTREIASELIRLKPDAILNMLHGPYGEDGSIQGVFEIFEIPYSHSGVLASALAMNKAAARTMFACSGVPIAEGTLVSRHDAARKHPMATPYVIKPVANGSSVGVRVVLDGDGPITELASDEWRFGEEVLVERYVAGKELTCAVMGDTALGVIEIISELPFYTYQAKYSAGGSQHVLPARVPKSIYTQVQALALRAHQALGCRGVSRSDFRYDDKSGELVCLEVNTQPGMTATSLVPELATHAGFSFTRLAHWMVEDTSVRR